MFINFEFGNWKSFRDIQTFSMKAAPIRANDHGLEEQNVITFEDLRLLKTKAVYGSNGSGKSNFASAIAAFSYLVAHSVKEENLTKNLWEERFGLISDWDDNPIFFQYTFSIEAEVYIYGFTVLDGIILNEWLFSERFNKRIEYFFRNGLELKVNEVNFPSAGIFMENSFTKNNELFRNDSLFLTAASLNGNKFAAFIRLGVRHILAIDSSTNTSASNFALEYMEDEKQCDLLKNFILLADKGIEDLKLEITDSPSDLNNHKKKSKISDKKNRTLYSFHSKFDENGKIVEKIKVPFSDWASGGTKKLLSIGVLSLIALSDGKIIVIDEFDAQLHPNLTLKIVNLFNNKRTNPHNAQLILITHDTGLLRRAELRRDQICLVDKNKFGISSMKTLIEYRGVRKDASYEKDYLNGVYNAVPFLDDIDISLMENIT